MASLRYLSLVDESLRGKWDVMVPVPVVGDYWGVLGVLRGTSWGSQIPEVTKAAFDHALHGYMSPLLKEWGTVPTQRGKRLPVVDAKCLSWAVCAGRSTQCFPNPSMPICYKSPLGDAATHVAKAWAEGRYVFVVKE